MKKKTFMLAIGLLAAALTAAQAQTSGAFGEGLTWALSGDGVLTLSGSGTMPTSMTGGSPTSGGAYKPWVAVANQIKSVVIEDGVSGPLSIGAFADCVNVTQVTIGKSITRIRNGAFRGTAITSIIIPEQIVDIELDGFNGANKLETIYFNAANCADMGAILDYPPFHRTKTPALKTIVIGSTVARIPAQLFSGANTITTLTIENGVTEIGMHAFANCTGLTGIAIPDSVVTIRNFAFENCSNATSITLGTDLATVMPGAFTGSKITELTIPENVIRLNEGCFANSTRLKTVYFNATACAQIGAGSPFSGSQLLESIIFGDNVRQIPPYIGAKLTGLYSITLGRRVNQFSGSYSFYGCLALEEVIINAPRPPRLDNSQFDGVDKSFVVLRVPAASVDAYKAANNWKDFTIEAQ
jgi:hypothetical protein